MKALRAFLATGAMVSLLAGTALSAASDDGLTVMSADELDDLNTMIDGPPIPVAPEVLARDDNGRATLRAVRLDEPLVVDGSLDEQIYATVPAMSGFVQQEPLAGEQATEQTDVWVFYDATSVYIAARLWDSHPERIVANEMRRDNRNIQSQNASFSVILDTFYDRRNGFLFRTTPLGALWDGQVTDERNVNSDWNTIWYVKSARFAEGWTLEMSLPFKSLRYRAGSSQVWGINFERRVKWKNERSHLVPIPAAFDRQGLLKLSFAAALVGIETPERSMNLEVKPYASGSMTTNRIADVPFENAGDADFGFDAKYGVTKGLIFDFTYNTDFAQVEADESQVNLTRFSLFFPEKREFFLEGQGIFNFGGRDTCAFSFDGPADAPIMFFSRRIGIDGGSEVPILAGGRLTGRAGAYSLGFLNITTKDVVPDSIPQTNYSVIRVKRDILARSNIGVIGTYRDNNLDGTGGNGLFGMDGNFTFYDNLNVNAYYAKTDTPGLDQGDTSYRAAAKYDADLYGFDAEHLLVDADFNPETGSCAGRISGKRARGHGTASGLARSKRSVSWTSRAASIATPRRRGASSRLRFSSWHRAFALRAATSRTLPTITIAKRFSRNSRLRKASSFPQGPIRSIACAEARGSAATGGSLDRWARSSAVSSAGRARS